MTIRDILTNYELKHNFKSIGLIDKFDIGPYITLKVGVQWMQFQSYRKLLNLLYACVFQQPFNKFAIPAGRNYFMDLIAKTA